MPQLSIEVFKNVRFPGKKNFEQEHTLGLDQTTAITPMGCQIDVLEIVDTTPYQRRNDTYTSLLDYGSQLAVPVRGWEKTPDTDIKVAKYRHSDGTPRIKFILPGNGFQEKEEWLLPSSTCVLVFKINGSPRIIKATALEESARFAEVELVSK